MIMSWVGMVTGRPSEGLRMLFVDSIRIRDSACAPAESGRRTAIRSPSKSAVQAEGPGGWSWLDLTKISWCANAWMPRQDSVVGRLRSHERGETGGPSGKGVL